MPYTDPQKKKDAAKRWFDARGGYAAHQRARRAQMSPEQREEERRRDRERYHARKRATTDDRAPAVVTEETP